MSDEHDHSDDEWRPLGISIAPGGDWWAVHYYPAGEGEEEHLDASPVVAWRIATFEAEDGKLVDEVAPLITDSDGNCEDARLISNLVGIYRREDLPIELLPIAASYEELLKLSREVFAERIAGDRTPEDADG